MDVHNLVVARYSDGRVLKGSTRDFSPTRPSLHIECASTHQMVEVRMRQLKAIFFVRTFEGYPGREDVKGFLAAPPEVAQGRKIAVRFRDGEFMCGYTMSWTPDREGFFLFPADADSNNDRVFVVTAATLEVKAGPQAEALAERMLAADAARPAPAGPGARILPGPGSRPGTAPGTIGGVTLGPRPPAPPRTGAA